MKPITHYQVKEDDPNTYIIVQDSEEPVSANFTASELYNSKVNSESHPIARDVLNCLQAVRDFYGVAIRVNSTYRNYIPTNGVAPASISPHMLAQAIDFTFLASEQVRNDLLMNVRDDFETKGPLFQRLWNIGCRGFGVYDTFIHIDTTVSELYEPFRRKRTTTHQGAMYAIWNKMKTLRYKSPSVLYQGQSVGGPIQDLKPANEVVEVVQEVSGVVVGYVQELLDSEDRGQDFTDLSIQYLIYFLITIVLFFAAFFAILSKPRRI